MSPRHKRCLMPGARFRNKSGTADEFPACNEESQLELHLQRQLEEDVARYLWLRHREITTECQQCGGRSEDTALHTLVECPAWARQREDLIAALSVVNISLETIFDESIYSDLEVVCGKLKILTHSCILKARTHKFYHKLHTILHVNIERSTFDEIYSFISDVYTECNIQHEEKEIITYLDSNLNLSKGHVEDPERFFSPKDINIVEATEAEPHRSKENLEEPEVFLTPKCITPYLENSVQTLINSSPSIDLTKEYYALVPLDGQLFDKELIEQDALSNAFQSIIKAQTEDTSQVKVALRNKPTSLCLTSSHTSKSVKHSSSCDSLNKFCLRDSTSPRHEQIINTVADQDFKTNQTNALSNKVDDNSVIKIINNSDLSTDRILDAGYSPDSLITDDPSSSSDYLSAAYACSPGVSSSGGSVQVNVGNNTTKMENIYTLSDSGLDDTAMLGSISGHKDVALTNISLSENTLHDSIADDASISVVSIPSSLTEKSHYMKTNAFSSEKDCNGQNSSTSKVTEMSGKSLKEQKQRQNEEIVILESSSLSSETGSWESVYPPKFIGREIREKCEKFLINERHHCFSQNSAIKSPETELPSSLVHKSPYKSTACFIDASSLVDENDIIQIATNIYEAQNVKLDILPAPSQPVPCSTVKVDISPIDWSESNDNEDSLEKAEEKDPDSIQKDLSPTMFEMTPITEDSLCANAFENAIQAQKDKAIEVEDNSYDMSDKEQSFRPNTMFMSNTPNNSIMSVKTYKHYDTEESVSPITIVGSESSTKKEREGSRSPPILSGGVSVEDHLPHIGSSHESSPLPKFKLENVPIVTGAYLPEAVDNTQGKTRTSSASAWVVDMSIDPKIDDSINNSPKNSEESVNEKKNIFSMYIDLGEKSTLKDMPPRLSSSINTKKSVVLNESKPVPKNSTVTVLSADRSSPKNKISEVSIFEKYESLCNDPNISISEIIGISKTHEVVPVVLEHPVTEISSEIKPAPPPVGNHILTRKDTIEVQTEPTIDQSKDLFVKLSDLDKPLPKSDITFTNETKEVDVRMTRSIPEHNWCEPSFSTNSRSIEVISSFHSENALSLNRLFPHLKNEFSRSMPGSLSSRTRSPLRLGTSSTLGDADEQASDVSEMSSMQSSHCRSGFGNSTTESQTSSLIENCTSRLGQDLLRMFLEEIAPDVIVEVSGKRFKAHKCILSSRCQYFAGILSGGWVESLGNVIVLPPFSYNVVYFALCHIYSGLATIPDSVSIVELATIADMLGLEGLKEAIMFTLKAKYCHHFHKPCAVCVVGVLECFPLSSVYGLDDLYHKCLKWITKHFSKVWPTKAFATLPTDLLDKCYQNHIVNLTIDNFIDTVYGCGITVSSLHNSRWAECVAKMCRRLINAAAHFAAPRLFTVLQAITLLPSEAPHAAKQALDDCISAAIEWAPPEEACRVYGFLSALVKDIRNQHYSKPDLIYNGTESHKGFGPNNLLYVHAGNWRQLCEGALVRASPRVVTTQAFEDLPSELRRKLRELGCIKYGAHALPLTSASCPERKLKQNIANNNKHNKITKTSAARSIDIAQVRASFVPYTSKPVLPLGSLDTLKSSTDLRDFKKQPPATHPPKVRTTKAQEERAKFNKTKNTKSQERLNKTTTARASFENTKPRYLEPKICKDKKTVVNKHLPKIESSSESSRNSSPIHIRNLRSSPQKTRRLDPGEPGHKEAHTMSQDSLATSSRPRTAEPSTDSLSESQTSNKYATYTKARHTKGSIESIKTSRCNDNVRSIANNKLKTKIPVYMNQLSKPKSTCETRSSRDPQKPCMMTSKIDALHRPIERKVPGSLMMATKSSSAKIVPKLIKEPVSSKNTLKSHRTAHVSRQHQNLVKEPQPLDVPTMERSGTFLKDEATFGDKITNIDIEQ